MGYDGKQVIHPCQIEANRNAFIHSDEEIEYAKRAIAALEEAERNGQGAVTVDGKMVYYANIRMIRPDELQGSSLVAPRRQKRAGPAPSLTVAHSGKLIQCTLTCTLFQNLNGAKSLEISYPGKGPLTSDLVASFVDYSCDQVKTVAPQIERLRQKNYDRLSKSFAIPRPICANSFPRTPGDGQMSFRQVAWLFNQRLIVQDRATTQWTDPMIEVCKFRVKQISESSSQMKPPLTFWPHQFALRT